MGCVEPDPTTVKIVPETAVLKEPEIRVCPATCREPVTVWVSVEAFPILTPVFVTWSSIAELVITVREPVITTFWFKGFTKEAVEANEALTAFKTYEDVVAKELLKACVA